MAGRRPNVVIDFTWLPWLAPATFRHAFGDWLSYVPLNRFVWGSDSGGSPESIVGTDRLTRRAIAEVLEQEIALGTLDERRALRFVGMAFRENPRRVFKLE